MSTTTRNGPGATLESRPRGGPTRFPDIFGELARPFDPRRIKVRTQAGRQLPYVTARTVMNRLDTVLGPENWWDDYERGEHSVICRLTVRLPDGLCVTKADAGGFAGMADPGDDDKSGYSDAFKRAAVKFGVGRHLYGDGVPTYDRSRPSGLEAEVEAIPDATPPPSPSPDNQSGHGKGIYASPEQTDAYAKAMEGFIAKRNAEWLDRWTRPDGEIPEALQKDLINRWQADNHLVKWAIQTRRLDPASMPEDSVKNRQIGRFTAIVYHRSAGDRKALANELERYCDEQADRQLQAISKSNPELFVTEGKDGEPVPIAADDEPDEASDEWPRERE